MTDSDRRVDAKDALKDAFKRCRTAFGAVAVFSFAVNLFILTLPIYMFAVFDKVLSSYSVATLGMLFAMALFALAIQGAVDVARSAVLIEIGNYLDRNLTARLLHASLAHSVKRGNTRGATILQQFNQLKAFLTSNSIYAIMDIPWIPVFMGVLFIMNPTVGLVSIVGAIALFMFAYLNDRASRGALMRAQKAMAPSYKRASAAARNADVVEAMGMTPTIVRTWSEGSEASIYHQSIASRRSALINAASKWTRMVIQITIMTSAAYQMIQPGSTMSPGVMMASVILVGRALMPLESMIGSYRSMLEALSSYKEMDEILASMIERPRLSVVPPKPKGHISIENVTYTVPGVDRPILSNVSLEIEAGEIIGVIGPSGAGKTTLATLMVGIDAPTHGHVRLDGTDVYAWPSEDLGRYLGYLPQAVALFDGTVRENICRLEPNASPQAIIKAAELAGLHEIIQRLPREYDTPVGDAGAIMSGGQRQRIGLARALYGDPLFVVLDEPNSNLDSQGEEALKDTLHALKARGCTVVLIAHRINVLQHVDKVLILRDGVVHKFAARDEVVGPVPAQTKPQIAASQDSPSIASRASS
ncbi:type I secretion system permease/ATPase [Thalassobaculum sp.]|uniref:type I secretion system permease/ATPase n=1 Tax=Thalassobaculum sp. TaxID=2022740 RepID=UPI0032EB5781